MKNESSENSSFSIASAVTSDIVVIDIKLWPKYLSIDQNRGFFKL